MSRPAVSCRGVSPIIATIFLCTITLAAVAVLSPLISSRLSSPVSSIAVTKATLVKQDSYVLLVVNVKNTGSSTLNLQCVLYDSDLTPHSVGGGKTVPPKGTASFEFESIELGGKFFVGSEYLVEITDPNYGRMAEVRVFCQGR
ncbi:MAG: hypothetical protein QFX35_03555 [Candidatus Verstraetearchaeota archaeon]|nr:hypothetical protein [Candidatus Verstraetearchaeota archaeon]